MQNLNGEILDLGRKIFDQIGDQQPKVFDKGFLETKLMEWSLSKPAFKTQLFQLVDVLPSLQSSDSIAQHIEQYLKDSAKEINSLFTLGFLPLKFGKVPSMVAAKVMRRSIQQMANVFIAGETAQSAIPQLQSLLDDGIAYTVDLLGEYSLSKKESLAYLNRYQTTIADLASELGNYDVKWQVNPRHLGVANTNCVSVKLTALYSQCHILNQNYSVQILSQHLSSLADLALETNTLLYVDAEDTGHNPIIYQTFKEVFKKEKYKQILLPGIVVQAYSPSSEKLLDDLIEFARTQKIKIAVRLVKGAYWDHEKASAELNFWENPLFTKKVATDEHYEAMSRKLLENTDYIYPAFGSHNIRSLCHACCYAKQINCPTENFELQMLYGMARPIARAFTAENYLVRMYVPIGELIPGMGYLVRRLLENTSNDSFLKHTFYDDFNVDELLKEPSLNKIQKDENHDL